MWNAYQQLKVTVTAGVGQSYVNPPVDNLENFNERPAHPANLQRLDPRRVHARGLPRVWGKLRH